MWIITRYVDSTITMFEYETEKEAREALKKMEGCTILTEMIDSNNPSLQRVAA